jgi:hypothetical protein
VRIIRYRVVALALLLMVAPSRPSFPCDMASPSAPATSPWDPYLYINDLHVGPLPRVFAFAPEDVPKLETPDGRLLDVDFEIVDAGELAVVDGLFVFAPREPLQPGTYCVPYQRCVTVEPTFDASVPSLTAEVSAIEYAGDPAINCGNSSCGPSEGRNVGVVIRGPDHYLDKRIANYLVTLSDERDYSRNVLPTIVAASAYLNLDHVMSKAHYDIDDFDQICAHVSAVLWDGTVGPAVDAGCSTFD